MTFGRTHDNATHFLPLEEQLDVARVGSNLVKTEKHFRTPLYERGMRDCDAPRAYSPNSIT